MNFLCKCIKNFVYVSVACFVEKKRKGFDTKSQTAINRTLTHSLVL